MDVNQLKIIDVLRQKKTFSAEIIPPRNSLGLNQAIEQLQKLKDENLDFISITKGAGGSLRAGTLPIAKIIQRDFNLCPLAHFTCRDTSIIDVENQLIEHHYFGIQNILALRGDLPTEQQGAHLSASLLPKDKEYQWAWQLVSHIQKLNKGLYLPRKGFSSGFEKGMQTDFCIGVAAYPEHEPLHQGVDYLKVKMDHGASFAITQMLYDASIYERFLEACMKQGIEIPIIPGLRILTQFKSAERIRKKFQVHVPPALESKMRQYEDPLDSKQFGLEYTLILAEKLLKIGAPGIHLFVMNDAGIAQTFFQSLR